MVQVPITSDEYVEHEEQFRVKIQFSSAPSVSERLCSPVKATVTIEDDDFPGKQS